MNNVATSMVIIPGVVALLLFLVFTYLYEQSRQQYFRAWQLGWGAYTLHFALDAWAIYGTVSYSSSFATQALLVAMGLCIFVSTRLMRERFRFRWYDLAIVVTGLGLVWWNLHRHAPAAITHEGSGPIVLRMENWLSVLLLYCAFDFFKYAQRKSSVAFGLLGTAVLMWAALMGFEQFHSPWVEMFGGVGHLLGPIPQMVLGISMVMVLFESERNAIQENALSFSTLGVDSSRLLSAEDLAPNMQGVLDRLAGPLHARKAVICITERWRTTLPSVQRGFSPEFLSKLEKTGAGEYICELTYRRGGVFTFRNVSEMTEPLPAFPGSRFGQFRQVLTQENIRNVTAVSLQTREHNFGVVMFPHAERRMFGASNLRLLTGLALQIGLTLENYVVVHNTQRRTKEYELLTQIGQAISSHLDQDEVLRTIQKELGQIFETADFYVAFQEGDEIRFEYEVERGKLLPKRSRKIDAGLTEYVIRTGQPLLIRSDLEEARKRLNVTYIPEHPAKCFCAAPILLGGKPAGVMAVLNVEREFLFEQPDMEIMQTAAGQVSVAVENARLFAEEQRRSRQLAFINNISRTAISSEDSEQMLAGIVLEIQKNFRFDHIGIGIFDYATKDIEMKAEAGITANSLGRRIPLGTGIVGRVARTGESALLQAAGEGRLQGILTDARAVLCIPINYGESLMGVLNVESRREDAFTPQDVLIMKTLADLLATALHNVFVFQKLQTQSITDGLTGIKTRRFFWEALSSEWKRASRSGRPFSVVLVDLDKFKEVNDSMGHLEGDLVLARVGRLLEQKCRQSNVVARYGGDEFIILMPETGVEQAQVLAERLRLWLATDPMMSEHQITGSFGVASFPVHGYSAEDIIRQADAGMYVSKHAGGDRVSVAEEFSEGEASAVRRQLISGYIEGFLQREHTGPEHLDELVLTLKRMATEEEENTVEVLQEAIEALAHAAEAREVGNSGHGEMTARYCEVIARALRLVPEEIADLSYTARVHNVGQLFVPDRVLNKPGPLTDDEFYLVKVHTRVGGEIVGTLPNSDNMRKAIEHHHEAFDGSGYPNGLRGEEIPLWARILSLADAYVNMTTDRSFAPAKTSQQAMAELEKLSGTHFDGMLVRILARELKEEKPSWTGGAKI